MPTIALVTARAARDLDDDLAPLREALLERGADVHVVDWDDEAIDWGSFDLAVLRSTWDYTDRLETFLAWVARAAAATRLVNPPGLVRWSTDKHYLADLEAAGIATVPSRFVEPGGDAATAIDAFLALHAANDLVVKPAVGAGSRDARRHAHDRRDDAVAHAQGLLDRGRSVLLQPYLDRVDEAGETALIHVDGTFSHAIRKGPLLRTNEDATRALFAAEHITAREPGEDERALARRVLDVLPVEGAPAYARVDLIRDADGAPVVLELELVEPSLFFAYAEGSALRFADALLRRAGHAVTEQG